MKAVFINAAARTVEDCEYDGELKTLYSKIGCRLVDIVHLWDDDDMFVDDEGLLSVTNSTPFFRIGDVTISGNAVIVGGDPQSGSSCDAHHDAEHYRGLVRFTTCGSEMMRRLIQDELNAESPF